MVTRVCVIHRVVWTAEGCVPVPAGGVSPAAGVCQHFL